MKLLAVYSTDRFLGGGEISFTLAIKALQEAGVEILTMVPGPGALADHLREAGIPFAVTPQDTFRRVSAFQYLVRPHPRWVAVTREYKPDIIHCNAIRPALYAQAVGRRLSIPVVMHARKTEHDAGVDHFLMRRLDAVICTSERVRGRFPTWVGSAQLRTIYNPVDPAFSESPGSKAHDLRKRWLGSSGDLLVGVIGRLSPIKGQHLVIEAAPEILTAAPATRFVFVGDEDPSFPGYTLQLKRLLEQRKIESKFTFAGYEADVLSCYHALDVVAFPTSSEGFGRVVIEAGAAQKALVVTELEVLRELLSPGLEDLIVPRDPKALAKRVIRFANDSAFRLQTAERLHQYVGEKFTLKAHCGQLIRLYTELTGQTH